MGLAVEVFARRFCILSGHSSQSPPLSGGLRRDTTGWFPNRAVVRRRRWPLRWPRRSTALSQCFMRYHVNRRGSSKTLDGPIAHSLPSAPRSRNRFADVVSQVAEHDRRAGDDGEDNCAGQEGRRRAALTVQNDRPEICLRHGEPPCYRTVHQRAASGRRGHHRT
jgi:hypothetical protein